MIIKKLTAFISQRIDNMMLYLEERYAIAKTTEDRHRRYIIKMGKHDFRTYTALDIKTINRILKKSYTVIDLFEVSVSIIEWSPFDGKVINFGKRKFRSSTDKITA